MTLSARLGTSAIVADDLSQLSFEDALKRLETIVHRLESGDETLDSAIQLYAEGAKLREACDERLKSAQERIDRIVLSADGTPTGLRPFDSN